MKNFELWETQDLEITFGLERNWQSDSLNQWLNAQTDFNLYEKQRIEKLRDKIFHFVDYWNEDELKLQAISHFLDLAEYNSAWYCIFSQRSFSGKVNEIEIGGRVDFMLAKGQQKPITPYFFIHEYKQESKRTKNDPKGQLLAELLVAQAKNENKFPLYGCYVLGRSWFFVILNQQQYAVSRAYDSSQEDIYQIIASLRKIKDYINDFIQQEKR